MLLWKFKVFLQITLAIITEGRMDWVQMVLWSTCSNPCSKGTPRPGCPGICWVSFWRSPRRDTTISLQRLTAIDSLYLRACSHLHWILLKINNIKGGSCGSFRKIWLDVHKHLRTKFMRLCYNNLSRGFMGVSQEQVYSTELSIIYLLPFRDSTYIY